MNLIAVGFNSKSKYVCQALEQMGVPCFLCPSLAEGIGNGVRVFIWGDRLEQAPEQGLRQRIAIITNHSCLGEREIPNPAGSETSSYFRIDEGMFGPRSFYIDLPVMKSAGANVGLCYDHHNNPLVNTGIRIHQSPDRLIVSLPWDIHHYVQGERWEHYPMYSPFTGKHYVGMGPPFDTGAFRRLLMDMLAFCFNWVDMPLIRVSPFYEGKKYFSIRIDTDGFKESAAKATLRIANRTGLCFSWFIAVEPWKNEKEMISKLMAANQNIQFHCFRHNTYLSQKVNEVNIRVGMKILCNYGVKPNAIVSPAGYYYKGFSDAIKKWGFLYSSEFGYACDDLPSYPGNDASYPLQIPTHVGCSASFSMGGFTKEEQFIHLFNKIVTQCELDGILIVYDHPINGFEIYEDEYVYLIKKLQDAGCEYINMSDYYHAWIGRSRNVVIVYDNGRIDAQSFQAKGFRLEQVVTSEKPVVLFNGTPLPQIRNPSSRDQYLFPSQNTREVLAEVKRKSLRSLRTRQFSTLMWYLYEVYDRLRMK